MIIKWAKSLQLERREHSEPSGSRRNQDQERISSGVSFVASLAPLRVQWDTETVETIDRKLAGKVAASAADPCLSLHSVKLGWRLDIASANACVCQQ
jgi:hypothetical protein